jgi:tRNA threonylcarbamoyladenosine biosynthesis protein TsaB
MKVLAIDTTSDAGSLALLDGDRVVEEAGIDGGPDGYAHLLFGAIQELLKRHSWTLADIDLYAAAAGPGAFTGVRVGLAAAKGLADAMGKPAAGVSNLQAYAAFEEGPVRKVCIDARRGEVYRGVYNGELEPMGPEVVTAPGDDDRVQPMRRLAAVIGKLAVRAGGVDPAGLDANYVRRSDAELFWRDN